MEVQAPSPRKRKAIIAALGVALLVGLFLLTLYTSGLTPMLRTRAGDPPSWSLRVMVALMQMVSGIWIFLVGASLGSFINVVVYRMPRGESIVLRPSHCPRCDANIRFRDNLPVLGWLWLGGRCRACNLPISRRYPLVELLAGIMFTSLAYVELLSAGANLPGSASRSTAGLSWTLIDVREETLWIFLYHALLLGVLLGASLIKYDGHSIPLKLLLTGLLVGVAVPAFQVGVHPVTWVSFYPLARLALPIGPPWDVMLFGVSIGGALGLLVTAVIPRRVIGWKTMASRPELAPLTALVGMYLGWQAVLACLLLASMLKTLETVAAAISREIVPLPLIAHLTFATYVQICLWRSLSSWSWWPGMRSSWTMVLVVAAACVGIVWIVGFIPPRRAASETVGTG